MIDLEKQYQNLKEELLESLGGALESTRYVLGPKVEEFEKKVATYMGVDHAVGVANGTDALHLALRCLGVGQGDEVITTPFTFFATVESILYVGARPVFADIEPETLNIDPEGIRAKITPRTKAILPVHIFGHPADMNTIMVVANSRGLRVVEDCAQAFGASRDGIKAGAFADAGCFSFYPSKNLGAYGDGGMVVLKDGDMASNIRKIRNHGSRGGYIHEDVGINSRLDELQAAILLVKLKRIDEYNEARRRIARLYDERLSAHVICPVEEEGCRHVYHQYTIRSPKRDKIKKTLEEAGISSTVYYPVPLHLQPALGFMGHKEGDFRVAEKAAREVLSLPMYPELEADVIERIAETILSV